MSDVFINVDKPIGVTSQRLDRAVKKMLNVKHVGHAGTLDPFASGVLPIAVGRAAKFIDFLSDDKSYRAEILFGRATDTGDCTGQTIEQLDDFEMPTVDRIKETIKSRHRRSSQPSSSTVERRMILLDATLILKYRLGL